MSMQMCSEISVKMSEGTLTFSSMEACGKPQLVCDYIISRHFTKTFIPT